MDLERDEFVVSFDAARVTQQQLLAASKDAGFPAKVVVNADETEVPAFFRDALDKAREEKKPLVVDFTAAWCEPCQRSSTRGLFSER